MPLHNIFLWIAIPAVIFAWLFLQIRQNQNILKRWPDLNAEQVRWFTRFAWQRTAQLMAALIMVALVIYYYDWRETSTVTPTTPELASIATPPKENYYPPIVKDPPPIPHTSPVQDIYNPEEKVTDRQSQIDSLKKRYEELLVTYFFLEKCEKTTPADYPVIIGALSNEAQSINAPERFQDDILIAAQGSYKEMYSKNTCDAKNIAALYGPYSDYVDQLSRDFQPQ
jgi:hypothetical protein